MTRVSKFVLLNFRFLSRVQYFPGQAVRQLPGPISFCCTTLLWKFAIPTICDGLVPCPSPVSTLSLPFEWSTGIVFVLTTARIFWAPPSQYFLLASIAGRDPGLLQPSCASVCCCCCVVSIALQLDKFLQVSHYAINFNCSSHHLFSSAGMPPSRRLIKPSRLAPKPSSSCLRLSEAHPGYVSVKMLLGENDGSYGRRNNENKKWQWVL